MWFKNFKVVSDYLKCVLPKLLKFTYITYMVQNKKHG